MRSFYAACGGMEPHTPTNIGMISYFAAKQYNLKNIVLTGNLTQISQAKEIFEGLNQMFDMNFVIPKNAQYSTVIGAALSSFEK